MVFSYVKREEKKVKVKGDDYQVKRWGEDLLNLIEN